MRFTKVRLLENREPFIFICGDSYAADYSTRDGWVEFLRNDLGKQYHVANYAGKGLSPMLSTFVVRDYARELAKSNDLLIFILPDTMRFNLQVIPEDKQALSATTPNASKKHLSYLKNTIGRQNLRFLFDFHKHYTFYHQNRSEEVMKYLSYLYLIGKKYFKKTLIIPTTPFPKTVDTGLFDNLDNFYLANFFLDDVSIDEGEAFKKVMKLHGEDDRTNHLCYENRVILKDQIKEWIFNNKIPTKDLFKTNVDNNE